MLTASVVAEYAVGIYVVWLVAIFILMSAHLLHSRSSFPEYMEAMGSVHVVVDEVYKGATGRIEFQGVVHGLQNAELTPCR